MKTNKTNINEKEKTTLFAIFFVENIYKLHYGYKLNWEQFDFRWIYKYDNMLYDIHEDKTNFQDKISLQNIKEAFTKFDKVMIVMGSQHAINQEEDLLRQF